MESEERDNKGILAVIGSSMAIFWPGALIFGFPGVMAPYWMKTFHVGRCLLSLLLWQPIASVSSILEQSSVWSLQPTALYRGYWVPP